MLSMKAMTFQKKKETLEESLNPYLEPSPSVNRYRKKRNQGSVIAEVERVLAFLERLGVFGDRHLKLCVLFGRFFFSREMSFLLNPSSLSSFFL